MPDLTNVGLQLETALNNEINKIAPRGMKAQAIRALLQLMLEKQRELLADGRTDFVVDHLLRGNCQLKIVINGKEL